MKMSIESELLERILYAEIVKILGGDFQITEVDGNMRGYANRIAVEIKSRAQLHPDWTSLGIPDNKPRWVNADVRKMAESLLGQAKEILDEDSNATARRVKLHRASAALLTAFAELDELSEISPR